MSPLLNIAWALLAGFTLCCCIFARQRLSPEARIALLLATLIVCPAITAAQDFSALMRPNDPASALETVTPYVIIPALGATTFVVCGILSPHDILPIAALVPRLLDSRPPPIAERA